MTSTKLPRVALFSAFLLTFPAAAAANSCEAIISIHLADTTITLAQSVAAGAFTMPKTPGLFVQGSTAAPQLRPPAALKEVSLTNLPAFCRVALTIRPSMDSDIKVEIWMPTSAWNGKFMAVGNGGWAGAISYALMAEPLARGYVTASTDTGHEGTNVDGSFALGHPDKLTDFGYRAVHEMTVQAKSIIASYYGTAPKLSYWNGCSTGGKQGLTEAQRFPADFDGIVVGAPANNWTHLQAQTIWVGQAVHKSEASYIPPSKYSLIHNAVLQACDTRDGVKDGILENPTQCKFDPKILECKTADGSTCLTAAQVETVGKIYGPATNPRTGQDIFPGLMPGSELGWAAQAGPTPVGIPYSYFKYVVFKDPNWDYTTFNFDSDIDFTDRVDHGTINATSPNLRAFFSRGGKVLQYHGWSDNLISPLNSVYYYESVINEMGGKRNVNSSYRLFMVPGMGHCLGGEGLNSFDSISVIEQWVEKRKTPKKILASAIRDNKTVRTRPLCPYPQAATYGGSGNPDDARNFVCRDVSSKHQ